MTWLQSLTPPANLSGQLLTAYVLFDVALIVLIARLLGNWMVKIGQPRVVGEILAGILLGPTLLGQNLSQVITPLEARPIISALATLGLILFMFIAGLDFDVEKALKKVKQAIFLALMAVGVPALLGFPIAYALHHSLYAGAAGADVLPFALFLGSALSVTAFPVMAHILMERGELNTSLGILGVATAGFVSIFMFNYIGFAGTMASGAEISELIRKLVFVLVFMVVSWFVIRPILGRFLVSKFSGEALEGTAVAVTFFGVIIFGVITQWLGLTALVGGFVWGVIFPLNQKLRKTVADRVRDVALVLLLPIFFAVSGFSTDLKLLTLESTPGILLMLLGAVGGKFLSAAFGKFLGLSWKEVGILGALLNTRGLLVLVVGLIGLQMEIITPIMYTIFVIVALVTNLMTLPLLNLFYRTKSKMSPTSASAKV